MDKCNPVLVDKFFEYHSERGLSGKQIKMLGVISREICKYMTPEIAQEISRTSFQFLQGIITMEEVNLRIEKIKKEMFKEDKDV